VIVLLLPLAVAWQATQSPAHMILWMLLVSLISSILPMGVIMWGAHTGRWDSHHVRNRAGRLVPSLALIFFSPAVSLPRPRPGHQIHRPVRCRFRPRPASGCCAPPLPDPESQRLRRTVDLERPPRVHRPATDLLPTPSANRHQDLHRPLQRSPSASLPGPTTTHSPARDDLDRPQRHRPPDDCSTV
jgi:hypothetical protein